MLEGVLCLWMSLVDGARLGGGEKVCRRDGFATVEKFKYP